MRNKGVVAALAVLACMSASAAEKPDEADVDLTKICDMNSMTDFTKIEDCVQRLSRYQKVEETLKGIAEARRAREQASSGGSSNFGSGQFFEAPPAQGQRSAVSTGAVPPSQGFSVEYVRAHDGEYTAALIDSHGARLFVKKGSSPEPNVKVIEVTLHHVVVENGGKRVELPFAPKKVAPMNITVSTSSGSTQR